MKKIIKVSLTFLILFLIFSSNVFSQSYNKYLFTEYQDEVFFPKIDKKVNKTNFDSIAEIANNAFDFYYKKGENQRAIYLFNIFAYSSVKSMPTKNTLPIIQEKIRFLKSKNDTTNTQFAVLLEIAGGSFKEQNDLQLSRKKEIAYFNRAVEIHKLANSNILLISNTYYSLAIKNMNSNKTIEGFNYFKKANDGFVSAGKNRNPKIEKIRIKHIAGSYSGMAIGMRATGQVELSLALSLRANEIEKSVSPMSYNRAINEVNISAYYIVLKDYKNAIKHANIADSVMNSQGYYNELFFSHVPMLRHRGYALRELGRYEDADKNFRKMVTLMNNKFGKNSPRLGYAYNEIAINFYQQQQYDSALYYYHEIKKLEPARNEVNEGLAKTYGKLKKYDLAIKQANLYLSGFIKKDSTKVPNTIPVADDFNRKYLGFQSANILAKLYFSYFTEKGDFENLKKSIAYSNLCDTLIGRHRDATMIGRDDANLAEEYHNIANIGISANYKAYENSKDEKYLNYFLKFITQSTAFKLNAEVNQLANKIGNSSEQIQLLQEIRKAENELFALKNSKDEKIKIELSDKVLQLKLKAYELSYKLQEANNEIVSKDLFAEIKCQDIQKVLQENENIVAYFKADDKLFSILIGKNTVKINSVKTGKQFDKDLKQYYKALKTGSKDIKIHSAKMYFYLLSSYENELKNSKKLIVIPDGELAQIPFEALVTGKGKNQKYLIEKLSVSYNYSIFLWLRSRKTEKERAEISFVGFAPVFAKNNNEISDLNPMRYSEELRSSYSEILSHNKLKPLPYSEKEVVQIAKLFTKNHKKAKVFTNKEASEENYKKNSANYSIIHIATHGYSSKKDPKLSGLFLYKNEDGKDITNDGFVYLGEIFTMKQDANLIVLSACKTGSGKITKGEGVLALPRAFIFAGTPNLIASLWKIHDKKTKNLMLDFYENLLNGKSYSEALRQAKLSQIKKGELPIDWSGIVLIGE